MTAFHCMMLVGLGDASRPARCSFFIFLKSLISRCRHRLDSAISSSTAPSVDVAMLSHERLCQNSMLLYT